MPLFDFSRITNRNPDTNKYDYGHVLIIGGSPGMVGAPFLSACAALRSGCGLVTIASTSEVIDKLEERVVEVMTHRISMDRLEEIVQFVEKRRVSVVVCGPGISEEFAVQTREIIGSMQCPVILDASAVTAFTNHLSQLDNDSRNNPNIIITPHDGEFAKLSGTVLSKESNSRNKTIAHFAQSHGITFVSKGFHALVGHPDGSVYENTTGNPGLATAGSGDVLTGVIAGLIAQKYDVASATDAGVYLHGLAADYAVKEKTQAGLIASDIIDFLPSALKG